MDMEIDEFFSKLAKMCGIGKCRNCEAREFCFTAPASMTKEIISRTIAMVGGTIDPGIRADELLSYPAYANRLLVRQIEGDAGALELCRGQAQEEHTRRNAT